jgi:hypothetical protein
LKPVKDEELSLVLGGVKRLMKSFGPAELGQMMEGAKGLFIIATLSAMAIGIVLGAFIACMNEMRERLYRRQPRSDRAGMNKATDRSPCRTGVQWWRFRLAALNYEIGLNQ